MIELRVLGGLEVRTDRSHGAEIALTQPRRLALLLYLALAEPTGFHSRDRLMALLWPDSDDESARHSLRNALHTLRGSLGKDALLRRGEGFVGLNFEAVRCDALELRRLAAEGQLEAAIALWRGELAPAFHVSGVAEFEQWLDTRRTDARQLVRAVAWRQADQCAGQGPAELEAVRTALRLDPAHEAGARRLMALLAGAGDRGGALHVYEQLVRQLADDLDAEPAAETRALMEQCRIASPSASPVHRIARPEVVPATFPAVAVAPRPAPRRALRATTVTAAAAALLAVGGGPYAAGPVPREPADAAAIQLALPLSGRYRADTSAYSSYLRGLTLRYRGRFAESRDTFVSLVARRPLYVPGLYGLAHAYIFTILNDLADPDDTWPKVRTLSLRALALDSTAGSAWATLAAGDVYTRMDLTRAGERLDRAWKADSLDADVMGVRAMWYRVRNRMDSAVAIAEQAHRRDPTSLQFARFFAKQLYFARRYDDSRRVYQGLVEDNPAWLQGYENLATIERITGHPSDALRWLRQGRLARGDTAAGRMLVAAGDSAALALIHAEARRNLANLFRARRAGQRIAAAQFALAYAALGDTADAIQWLDSLSAHHDPLRVVVRVDPQFDFIRSRPAYLAWERRGGFPPLDSPPDRHSTDRVNTAAR